MEMKTTKSDSAENDNKNDNPITYLGQQGIWYG